MMLLFRWLLNALALLLVANLVPGIHVGSLYTALLVALVLGIINAVLRPLLLLLTLPITVLTLGIFALIVNALLFWLASTVVKGFMVDGFVPAFWGALLLWVLSWGTNMLLRES